MTSPELRARAATPADAAACRAIYAPYVEDSAVSFEERA
ncbi:MAG: GNAT family N-acetyltransferase, partial [Marmoricola sp.]|nr:GNAT family N-acetyltransferase [Marmoricola sp.]